MNRREFLRGVVGSLLLASSAQEEEEVATPEFDLNKYMEAGGWRRSGAQWEHVYGHVWTDKEMRETGKYPSGVASFGFVLSELPDELP